MFLRKGVLKMCSKFTGEHPCLQSNFIEITLGYGCSPVNLLHIFKTLLPRNTSGWLFLNIESQGHSNYDENNSETITASRIPLQKG